MQAWLGSFGRCQGLPGAEVSGVMSCVGMDYSDWFSLCLFQLLLHLLLLLLPLQRRLRLRPLGTLRPLRMLRPHYCHYDDD